MTARRIVSVIFDGLQPIGTAETLCRVSSAGWASPRPSTATGSA